MTSVKKRITIRMTMKRKRSFVDDSDHRLNSQCFVIISEANALLPRQRFESEAEAEAKDEKPSILLFARCLALEEGPRAFASAAAFSVTSPATAAAAATAGAAAAEGQLRRISLPPAIEWKLRDMLAYEK